MGHFYFIRGGWIGQSVNGTHDQYENRQLKKSSKIDQGRFF